MVGVFVRAWVKHFAFGSPHKDRSTRMSVFVCCEGKQEDIRDKFSFYGFSGP